MMVKPVAYASMTLSSTERNYSQIDKEALAIIFGVKKFHQYLLSAKFTIYMDHKPLLGILGSDKCISQILSPRMLRWRLLLNSYAYTLIYRPGKYQGNADALSRLLLPESCETTPDPQDVLLI